MILISSDYFVPFSVAPVRLRLQGGTARAVSVFGSSDFSGEGGVSVLYSFTRVPVSVPEKWFLSVPGETVPTVGKVSTKTHFQSQFRITFFVGAAFLFECHFRVRDLCPPRVWTTKGNLTIH